MLGEAITRRAMLKYTGTIGGATIIGGRSRATNPIAKQADTETVHIPVALSPDGPAEYEIAATLTLPSKNDRRPVVQVLVHGLTYARYYFDFPHSEWYSYVTHITETGYPTLNIDRIGSGTSSHPPPKQLTLTAQAVVLQQVIQALQTGEDGEIEASEVVLVGHGYGSLVAVKQQAEYGTADFLVLTGYTQQYAHLPNLPSWLAPSETIPVQQTSRPHVTNLPPGYRTTPSGRQTAYYNEANANPTVIALDDQHSQPFTETELETATAVVDESLNVTVPVLEIVGDQDSVFCGTKACTAPLGARTTEPLLWPNADFTMEVLPGVGHALFLHQSAPTAFSQIEMWVNERVASNSISEF